MRHETKTRAARLLRAAAQAACGLTLVACAAPGTPDMAAAEKPIWLAMVNVRSGPAASVGVALQQGAQAVFDEVNEGGGVHGRPVKMAVSDDASDPDKTLAETLKLLDRHDVVSLFGYTGTASVHAVLPLVQSRGLPMVGSVTGAMSARRPLSREAFNLRPSYMQEAETLVAHLTAQGAQRIAIVYQDDGFGLSVLAATRQALERRGMKLAAIGDFQRGTVAVRTAYAAMAQAKPDAIVLAGAQPAMAELVRKLHTDGSQAKLAGVSVVGAERMLAELGPLANGMVFSQALPFPGDDQVPVVRECRRLVKARAQVDLDYARLEGCVSAMLMVRALQKAGSNLNGRDLMQGLERMGPLDLGGITVAFDPDKLQTPQPVYLTQIRGNRLMPIPATPPAVARDRPAPPAGTSML